MYEELSNSGVILNDLSGSMDPVPYLMAKQQGLGDNRKLITVGFFSPCLVLPNWEGQEEGGDGVVRMLLIGSARCGFCFVSLLGLRCLPDTYLCPRVIPVSSGIMPK